VLVDVLICCEFMYTGEGDVAPSLSFLCIWNACVYRLLVMFVLDGSSNRFSSIMCGSDIRASSTTRQIS
jgi:hypothetical protein